MKEEDINDMAKALGRFGATKEEAEKVSHVLEKNKPWNWDSFVAGFYIGLLFMVAILIML